MTVPKGHLPVFGCDTEEQAKALITATCSLGYQGEYIARELAEEQTIESLSVFSSRLEAVWDRIAPNHGWPSVEELSRRRGDER